MPERFAACWPLRIGRREDLEPWSERHMARTSSKMQQASISVFFEKNKYFLGFDTLPRSIITAVKEAVDNSLDAAEEKRILPEISIEIRKTKKKDELILICQDNGPGIPHNSLGKAFGSLLFGSRFHSIR